MGLIEDAQRAYAKFIDRDTTPGTPASGFALLYIEGGVLYSINDAGVTTAYTPAPSSSTDVVAASGATEELTMAPVGVDKVYDVTMDEDCTFSFAGALNEVGYSVTLILRGAFTPTFPAAVDWADGTAPTYGSPSVYEFLTTDGGTTIYGFLAGASFA